MSLQALLASATPIRHKLRSSGNPESTNVETRLDVSARHVAATRLGAELFDSPGALGVFADGATVQTGALLMAFGSGQTSIDLCATALLRWLGAVPPPGREHDFGDLRQRVEDGRVRLTKDEQSWFDAIATSNTGGQLTDLRHAIIHRVVRQDVRVVIGGNHSTTISPSTASAGTEEANITLNRVAKFVEDRWHDFWQGLRM
ncbi:MAG: hypothetical protein P1T08_17420 [Acidimicrobiia bacterium]|nr:hypothetical protein [Acidimicrobiia bacterium]